MKWYTLLIAVLFIYVNPVHAQRKQAADSIIHDAELLAGKENKQAFIIFSASWCGWCHRMDSAMNDASCKALFTGNYIIRHLGVYELPEHKDFENPGVNEVLQKYHGDKQGVPYWIILDKNGKLLADAQQIPEGAPAGTQGENTGCPSTQKEIAYFLQVLKKTSALTPAQLTVIAKSFSRYGTLVK